jgi:hypothetical protein
LPTRSSRCASTCTTLVSPISRPRNASFGTSREPSTTACFFAAPLRRTSSSTLMLIGSIVPTLVGPLRATWCSWATTSSPSLQSVRTSSPVRALRRSTAPWPMAWQRHVGFSSCLWSCIAPFRGPLWSTATASALSTSPPTPFSIIASSMLRLISLCPRVCCRQGRSCSPCPDDFSVHRHLHQQAALLGVVGVSV